MPAQPGPVTLPEAGCISHNEQLWPPPWPVSGTAAWSRQEVALEAKAEVMGVQQAGSRAPGLCAALLGTRHQGGHREVIVAGLLGINPLHPESCK